ncbi:tRNA methyltransferase 10 B [Phytophthora citrophthora]|uniref:tRNA (guanine(9)-N(1))-methyltransferase n=1 Tax=Phytophthora citrophthora TaxID=4793 RepID=A0AAD9H0Q9_9STRA|nr:tRNA methyltransferase 10 B [Phytophthora citrophthora]
MDRLSGYRYGLHWLNAREKPTKQLRREMERSKRRNRKDGRLKVKKQERSQALATQRAEMTEEQKSEKRERTRMQRVEQYQKLEEAQTTGVRVVVDLAFAAQQTTRERHSIFKQLGCVYGYLKTCPLDRLVSLRLVSCTQELAAICVQHGVPSWKIGKHEDALEQIYDSNELVYLSPDSENVLEQLDPACVYVVGGIVDRSVRKVGWIHSFKSQIVHLTHCDPCKQGETQTKAASRGIRTARLPLQEYFEKAGTRVRTHVMNVDSVIMVLNEVANHGDWGRAFQRAVPLRITRTKQHQKKTTNG